MISCLSAMCMSLGEVMPNAIGVSSIVVTSGGAIHDAGGFDRIGYVSSMPVELTARAAAICAGSF